MFSPNRMVGAFVGVVVCLGANSFATVIVDIQPESPEITVGQVLTARIVATLPDPVVGWGLDLAYDHAVLDMVGDAAIGPAWLPVSTPDGDGLAGLAFPVGVSGTGILLATLRFAAVGLGETDLTLRVTSGDLTEGFPLDPTGFAAMNLGTAHVRVVPEPGGAALLLLAGALAIGRRVRKQ